MKQVIEAIFSNGVLRPVHPLPLREDERVKITVESIDWPTAEERAQAIQRFNEGVERMKFRSNGPYPTRDELHERR